MVPFLSLLAKLLSSLYYVSMTHSPFRLLVPTSRVQFIRCFQHISHELRKTLNLINYNLKFNSFLILPLLISTTSYEDKISM